MQHYSEIDSTIVKNVKYQARRLKLSKCFTHETREDLEQELFCEVWPYLDKYDENKGSFSAFVRKLTEHRANNLLNKQLCMKRDINNYVNIEKEECFADDIEKRADVDYMISILPSKWQKICEQLKHFNLCEVAKMNNISRTTLNNIILKIRKQLSPLYYQGKKKI